MRSCLLSFCCLILAVGAFAQSTEQLMSQGADQLRGGDYAQAVSSFKRVVQRDPQNFEAQFNLALANLAWGHDQDAVDGFRKASSLNSGNSDVWANMGVAYERLGNRSKAVESLSRAVSINSGNIEARINLASLYADMGRSGEAITQFKQVIAADGRNIVAHINVARLLAAKKEFAEAKKYLNNALIAEPGNAEVRWELGNILFKDEKKLDEAIAEYRKAVSLEPTTQVFYDELGQALEAQGKKKEAIDVYQSYLAYLSDAIKKEEIEKRISRLENPEAAAGSGDQSGQRARRREVPAAQTMGTMQVDQSASDIMGDLNDLSKEPEKIDLTEEAKKRKGGK